MTYTRQPAFDQISDIAARIGAHIEALDAGDVAMTCSKTIDALARDWDLVASVDITADRQTVRFLSKDEDGALYSMTGRMEIRFADKSVVERPIIVVAAIDEDTGIGTVCIDVCIP